MSKIMEEMKALLDKEGKEVYTEVPEITEEEEKEIIEKGTKHVIRDDSLEVTVYIYNNRLHVFEVRKLHG